MYYGELKMTRQQPVAGKPHLTKVRGSKEWRCHMDGFNLIPITYPDNAPREGYLVRSYKLFIGANYRRLRGLSGLDVLV